MDLDNEEYNATKNKEKQEAIEVIEKMFKFWYLDEDEKKALMTAIMSLKNDLEGEHIPRID